MTPLEILLDSLGVDPVSLQPFAEYDTGPGFVFSTGGTEALPLWYALRCAAASTGFWPVLLGNEDGYADHEANLRDYVYTQDSNNRIIAATDIITPTLSDDPVIWFRSRAQRYEQQYQLYGMPYDLKEPPCIATTNKGVRPGATPEWRLRSDPYFFEVNTFSFPMERLHLKPNLFDPSFHIQPAPKVYLALFPTQTAWHVPAYMPYHGWNDMPLAEEQLIAWRWWHEQHGAEIVGLAGDSLEAWVAAPPTTPEQIARLVWEHQIYCPDVDQAVHGQLHDMAASSVWHFWWD